MNASDYLDHQLGDAPSSDEVATQPASASDYIDSQIGQSPRVSSTAELPKSSSTEKFLNAINSPFSGLENSAVDTAVGGAQGLSRVMGWNNVGDALKKFEQMKNESLNETLNNNPAATAGYVGGDIAGNVGLFNAAAGANPGYLKTMAVGTGLGASQPADKDNTDVLGYSVPTQAVNAGIGGAGALAGKAMGNIFSSQINDPTKLAAVKTAEDFNIPIYRSQVSDVPATRIGASFMKELPGSGAESLIDTQRGAFNSAVLGTIGQRGDAVTPEALSAADKQIGNVYDNMTSKYQMPVTQGFLQKLDNLENDVSSIGDQTKEHALQSQINTVRSKVQNALSGQPSSGQGVIDGKTYQGIRSRIGSLLRSQSGSPELGQLQSLLDDQFQGSMNPADSLIFQQARGQYRNLLALQKVVGNNPNEAISPGKLQGAVKNVFGDYAYGGGSDLERLARLGNLLKDSYPNSGTASRNQLWDLTKHIGATGLALGAGGELGREETNSNPFGVAAGALGALGLSRYGLTPFLYSKMSSNPSAASTALSALGYSAPFSLSPQNSQGNQ